MPLDLTILYRGPLSSCNYDCAYCPFAKQHESARELAADRAALERFVTWVASRSEDSLAVFFTPWGEALVHRHYQAAFVTLSHLPHIRKVAVQTNLSCRLDWLAGCNVTKLGLWCTYHPSQVRRDVFLSQCRELDRMGVPHSVGMVGLRENFQFDEIEQLRAELPATTYLWINAAEGIFPPYTDDEIQRLERIDPLFRMNTQDHASLGHSCRCGTSVVSVDGEGTLRRCHFVKSALGNIYEAGWETVLHDRPCPNRTCGCHIGYVHLDRLKQYAVYGHGILERIPSGGW